MPTVTVPRRRARAPQLEARTPLVALAAARQVVEEAGAWLGVALPGAYVHGLAHRARRTFVHGTAFRRRVARGGEAGRDHLYVFLRHWLAARLQAEQPGLYRRLPRGYAAGAELPPQAQPDAGRVTPGAQHHCAILHEALWG